MQNYTIERMTKDEVNLVISWAANEGWNPGLKDALCFYAADPQGFFAGKLDGKIIATGSAIIYDQAFAFLGFYIVDKAYRDKGYGLTLTKHRLAYIGERNAGIDGVTSMVNKYTRLGYKIAHYNIRYCCQSLNTPSTINPALIPLSQTNFDLLLDYDRQHFPANRARFLRCWINQPDSLALAYINDGHIRGYGVIRACQQGFKIGPLFANNQLIAETLFLALAHYAKGKMFFIDIPENNKNALDLVNHYQLTKVFETARMYLKEQPKLAIDQIYGITTFELG